MQREHKVKFKSKGKYGIDGNAFVEFAVEIKFKKNEHQHKVKLTAYSTTCMIMLQQIGDQPEPKTQLQNRSVPRYFAEEVLIPWCEKSLLGSFNKGFSEFIISKLTEEVGKLEGNKHENNKKINRNTKKL